MKVTTMRRVDRWIGVPACAALTLLRRLGAPFSRRDPGQPPKRIAIVKLAEQGRRSWPIPR